ncbi:MAG: hypothetical protein KBG42_01905 [Lachnospiraceae bacterium]|jgi:hypothetical protein|nr:hypothetical protein [Lachnospiraceae bacterium]
METIYSSLKVNNEFELCNVYSEEAKNLLEQALLKARISYYMNYPRKRLFDRHKFNCIFCVNENNLAEAEEIVYELFGEEDPVIKMISQKNPVDYL